MQPELDFYLHIGDVGYPDDAVLVASSFEEVWTRYWDSIQPFTSVKPYMVSRLLSLVCDFFFFKVSPFTIITAGSTRQPRSRVP